jgi:hypothetical protein
VAKELAGYTTSKDQLRALLDFYATYVFNPPVPGGCPLLNVAVEADDHRVNMRKVVTSELLRSVNFIRDLIQRGKENNEFRDDVNPSEIAYSFFCATEGALMFSRAERSAEPMNIVVAHCKKILDQITK